MSIIPSTGLAEAICDWTIDIRDICRTYVSNIYDWTGIKEEGMQSAPRFSHFNYIHNDDVISRIV